MDVERTNQMSAAREPGLKPTRAKALRESVVERALVEEAKDAGGVAIKLAAPGERGWPDRMVLLPGGFVMFVELKRPGGRPSKLQQYRLRVLRDLGFVATYVDTPERARALVRGELK